MSKFSKLVSLIPFRVWLYAVLAFVVFIVIMVFISRCENSNEMSIVSNDKIDLTPNQIQQIEAIGEWEFLAIENEELVDTVKYGFFGDDKLVRIYYGTLRLGVNMHEAGPRWLSMQGDTLCATLPPVKLLDANFIDEARTQSFFSSGSWSDADRELLYQKANVMMRKRCLTPANIALAENNARLQFGSLLRSMGFDKTKVVFDNAKSVAQKEG